MSTATNDQILKDIVDRVAQTVNPTIDERLSVDKIKELVRTALADLNDDDPIVRKMRFGGNGDSHLIGSKYARHGLNAGDIEFLYDLQTSLTGQRKVDSGFYRGPSEELERAFKAVSDAYYLPDEEVRKLDAQALDNVFPRIPRSVFMKQGTTREQAHADAIRAMDTAESGYGSQLVGAQYVGDLWDAARPDSRVFGLLNSFEMTAPTAYLPVEADLPEMLFVSESSANNSSNYTTSKTGSNRVTVTAKKFLIHQMWSGEMEEDSIIPFIPYLRRQAALSLAHYADSAVLNGDTTNAGTGNINLDDADPADTKHYLAFDGIRHAPIVDNTNNHVTTGGAVTFAQLRNLRTLMKDATNLFDWGHPTRADDLVYIADTVTADFIATLDEVLSAKIQGGMSADLLNGEVARILGHPVISSMAMSLTEADGKVSTTGSNNTLGQVVAVNRRGFIVGWRRRIKFETERLPATDQTRLVYSLRMGLGRYSATGAASGIEAAAALSNITVS